MTTPLKKPRKDDIVIAEADETVSQSVEPECSAMEPELFREMITALAYYKAEQRGFAPGHELADWLEAEREILGDPSLLQNRTD
jgi:hypothetical protein